VKEMQTWLGEQQIVNLNVDAFVPEEVDKRYEVFADLFRTALAQNTLPVGFRVFEGQAGNLNSLFYTRWHSKQLKVGFSYRRSNHVTTSWLPNSGMVNISKEKEYPRLNNKELMKEWMKEMEEELGHYRNLGVVIVLTIKTPNIRAALIERWPNQELGLHQIVLEEGTTFTVTKISDNEILPVVPPSAPYASPSIIQCPVIWCDVTKE
jgi:hypothetical protein